MEGGALSWLARYWRRVLVIPLLALVAGWALWLVGVNWFLGSDLIASVIGRRPERLLVEWSEARSFVPGRFTVRDLRVRGQNRFMQWEVEGEELELSVDLFALIGKSFSASDVSGRGLQFRMRRRPHEGVELPGIDAFPEIAGLDITTREAPPTNRKTNPGWRIELADLDLAEFDQIWIDSYNLSGNGTVTGDFRFQIRGEMDSDEVQLEWSGGALARGRLMRSRATARGVAALNFGDCMSYAVARLADVPLLFVGDDFRRTDIAIA